jgi:hypothetical protein
MSQTIGISMTLPWAKVGEVRVGSHLICDGGFTCVPQGKRVTVKEAEDGLYFKCSEGRHYLCGQVDDEGCLIGLSVYPGAKLQKKGSTI